MCSIFSDPKYMRLKIRNEQDILLKRVTLSAAILVVGFS